MKILRFIESYWKRKGFINKILLEKEIGMTQYSMLAYELEKSGKVDLEEIPITKEKIVELLKK